jgi:hypothetical protein
LIGVDRAQLVVVESGLFVLDEERPKGRVEGFIRTLELEAV